MKIVLDLHFGDSVLDNWRIWDDDERDAVRELLRKRDWLSEEERRAENSRWHARWSDKNPGLHAALCREYYAKNKEKCRERVKAYKQRNRDAINARRRERYRLRLTGPHGPVGVRTA